MIRKGSDTASSSQADSAYDRYAMGKNQYQAPQNDGEDWDEILPCAPPFLCATRELLTEFYSPCAASAGIICNGLTLTPSTE